jgi:dienelactone hydrolase
MATQGLLFAAAVAVTLCLTGVRMYREISYELSRTEKCDTTYINPRYETVPVEFDVPYSLIRYREAPSAWVPDYVGHRASEVAVLFIHGHMGSHEQMRSMASETAKEISRRIKGKERVQSVDWYATDFMEEPSGLEPRLLDRQSAFVVSCLDYLLQNPGASLQYSKVVLLGYSMGGLVVDRVLEKHLQRDELVKSIGMAITLGSPHFHLPTLVVPSTAGSGATVQHNVPSLHIFSGPGDLLVPSISAWAIHTKDETRNDGLIEVEMENIPGVWGTASHKGLVSCNQLVRRIIPLILDGIQLESRDELLRIMKKRMTSQVNVALTIFSASLGYDVSGILKQDIATISLDECSLMKNRVHVYNLDNSGKENGCFIRHLRGAAKDDMVQVVVHGLTPGQDVRILGANGREVVDLSNMLSALPPSAIDEPTNNRRYWQDIIEGINWMQNSTWVLEASIEALEGIDIKSIIVVLSNGSINTLYGQGISVVLAPSNSRRVTIPKAIIKDTSVVEIHVPSLLSHHMRFIRWMFPFVSTRSWKLLMQLMPFKVLVEAQGCDKVSDGITPPHRPVVISKMDPVERVLDSDQIMTSLQPSRIEIPLWHPSLLSESIFVLVDPCCQHSTMLRLDFGSAMIYSIRYHAFALPGYWLASTIIRLVPVDIDRGNTHGKWGLQLPTVRYYCIAMLIMMTSGSVLSRALNFMQAGAVPWLFLQTPLSILSILWVGTCLEVFFKIIACTCINWMSRVASLIPLSKMHPNWFVVGVLVCCVLHDYVALFVASLSLYVMATYSEYRYVGMHSIVEWAFILASGILPMVIAMSGGTLIGYSHRELYGILSPERLLVSFTALMTFSILSKEGVAVPWVLSWWRWLFAGIGYMALLSSLFGYCFIAPFLVALTLLANIVLHVSLWASQRRLIK